jgi:hypothetical protein
MADYPGLRTYDPDPFDPRETANLATRVTAPIGMIYPTKRRNRSGTSAAFLLVALLVAGFFAWRQFGDSTAKDAASPQFLYRSRTAHFVASFPNAATEVTLKTKFRGGSVTVHAAGDQTSKLGVETLQFSSAVGQRQIRTSLRILVRDLEDGPSLTLKSQRPTVFRGHPAQAGQFWAMDGTPFSALAIYYNSRRFYILIGPTGDTFDAMRTSFVPLA